MRCGRRDGRSGGRAGPGAHDGAARPAEPRSLLCSLTAPACPVRPVRPARPPSPSPCPPHPRNPPPSPLPASSPVPAAPPAPPPAGFKQLASYSIKCLQQLLQPSRIGFELQARAAFEHGGTRAVLDVLVKYPGDAELLRFGLSALRSMVAVPSAAPLDAETPQLSLALLQALLGEGDKSAAQAAEALSAGDRSTATSEALDYMLALARRAPAALPEAELFRLLATVCSKLAAPPAASAGAAASEAAAAKLVLAGTVFRLVFALVSSREGLARLAGDSALLARLLAALKAVHDEGLTAIQADSARAAAAAAAGGAGAGAAKGGKGAAAAAFTTARTVKVALDPLVRVFDRLSRVPDGVDALTAAKAAPALATLADWWMLAADDAADLQSAAQAGAGAGAGADAAARAAAADFARAAAGVLSSAGMLDLLNRLAGNAMGDVLASLARAEAIATAGGAPIWVAKQRSARLLAKLCELPERASALSRDKAQTVKVVDMLQVSVDVFADMFAEGAPAANPEAAAAELSSAVSLLQLLCRVAERPSSATVSGVQMALDAGAMWAALTALEAVKDVSAHMPELNVLHTAAGASALRLLTALLSLAPDAEVSYHGYVMEEIGGEHNRTCLAAAVGRGDGALIAQLSAILYAPVDAPVDSSFFLSQLARLTYASACARELLLLGEGGDPAQSILVAESGLSASPRAGKLSDATRELSTALGVALATAGRGVATVGDALKSAPAADAAAWAWMPAAAAGMAIDSAATCCAGEAATACVIEAGGLSGLLCVLTGKADEAGGAGILRQPSSGTKKLLKRQVSGVQIAGRTLNYGWVRALLREQPAALEAGTAYSRESPRLAANALSLAAGFMTFLAPHAPLGDGAGAASGAAPLSAAALSTVQAVGKKRLAGADGGAAGAATGSEQQVRACIDGVLEACLTTYAAHPSDDDVYEAFKEVVDEAGISTHELTAATDGLRGVTAALRAALGNAKLLVSGVRASAATTVAANVAGALRGIDAPLEGTVMAFLETDPSDKDLAKATAASLAAVRAQVPASAPLVLQLFRLLGLARERLLLLEAVSLSPQLSWVFCFVNGVHPLLSLVACLVAAATAHADMVAEATGIAAGATTAALAARIDDVMSHACVVLGNLARVAFEVRQSGEFAVVEEGDDGTADSDIPPGLDRRLVVAQTFSPYMASIICAATSALTASGLKLPLFIAAAVPLSGWLAAAVNLQGPDGDDGFTERYLSTLLSAEFTEASVALLRLSLAMIGRAAEEKAKSSSDAGRADADLAADAASARITYDVVATIVSNLQHLAVHAPGAMAVTTRGATRQLLRAIPVLTAACGSNQRHASYRALVAVLNVLNVCVSVDDDAANASDDAPGGSAPSVARLLYKQGLVSSMLQVVFSGVGVGATQSEACELALSIVSAVSGRRDVLAALAALQDMAARVADAVGEYASAAGTESDAWAGVGKEAKAAPAVKHAVVSIESLDEADGAGSKGADGGAAADDDAGGAGGATKTSPMLGALQVFGLLVTTDAGRKTGMDTAAAGVAACTSLLRSATAYAGAAARLQDSVLAAAAALTASVDDKPPAALPTAIAAAAAKVLAAPPRTERDLLWAVPTACQVVRVTLGVMGATAEAASAEAGGARSGAGAAADPLSGAAAAKPALAKGLAGAVQAGVALLEAAMQPGLQRLASGAAGAALLAGGSGGAGSGTAGKRAGTAADDSAKNAAMALPSSASFVVESSSTLAALASTRVCAAAVPGCSGGTGLDVVLGALDLAHDRKLVGAAGAAGEGADAASPESQGLSAEFNVLAVLDGVAASSADVATSLAKKDATDKIMSVLAEVVQAASASGLSATDAAAGLAHALSALSALAAAPHEIERMLGAGLISYLRSASVLLPDESSGADAGAEGAEAAVLALLTRSMARLLSRLLTVGNAMNGDESDDAELSGETLYSATLRELLVRVCATAGASAAVGASLPAVHACLQLTLDFCAPAADVLPKASADRSLAAVRAGAARIVAVAKKAMTSGGAGPELISLGRKVIALVAVKGAASAAAAPAEVGDTSPGKSRAPASPGAAAAPATPAAPAEDADELRGAVNELKAKLARLDKLVHEFTDSSQGPAASAAAAAARLRGAADGVLDELLEAVRSLSLQVSQRFPMTVTEDGAGLVPEAQAAEAEELRASLDASAVTESGVFAALRRALSGVGAVLCDDRARPALSKRAQAAAYDVVSATLPLVARMANFAEGLRSARLDDYYAKKVPDWDLPAERDVPIGDALAVVSQALELHVHPLEAMLAVSGASAASGGADAAAGRSERDAALLGSYAPSAAAVEAVMCCMRAIVAGCGKDGVTAVAEAGSLRHALRLAQGLRSATEDASAGQLEGGRERGRAIAAECDKAISSINVTTKLLLAKSESEIRLYAHQSGDDGDDIRHVDTIVSVSALKELLKAAAGMAANAAGDEAGEDDEPGAGKTARKTAADVALESQANALVTGENGREAAWNVLDGIASDALSAISGTANAPEADSGGKLKLFSTVLQALAEDAEREVAAGRGDREVPASLPVLRTLYATIATCMQVLTGDGYREAMQASAKASLARDEAADEFAPAAVRDQDTDVGLWTAPAVGTARVASSKAEDAVVEEL